MVWQLQEAKQRLSELVRRAETDGPQFVTRHGQEVAVVMSAEEFRRLRPDGRPNFREFLMQAPDLDALDIRRDGESAREIHL